MGANDAPGVKLRALFLAHRGELQAYLQRKLRDVETASDLTQETFARFAEQCARPELAPVTNSRAYLYRTARNLAVDHIRGSQWEDLRPSNDAVLLDYPDQAPGPAHWAADRSELDHLRNLLTDLPLRTREVFVRTRVDGLTYRKAALQLGISESSVQKHLARALAHVMAHFPREDRSCHG